MLVPSSSSSMQGPIVNGDDHTPGPGSGLLTTSASRHCPGTKMRLPQHSSVTRHHAGRDWPADRISRISCWKPQPPVVVSGYATAAVANASRSASGPRDRRPQPGSCEISQAQSAGARHRDDGSAPRAAGAPTCRRRNSDSSGNTSPQPGRPSSRTRGARRLCLYLNSPTDSAEEPSTASSGAPCACRAGSAPSPADRPPASAGTAGRWRH